MKRPSLVGWDATDRVALEFSGGRDSLACLYLLRHRLHEMTVYWLDSGDNFPETYELVDWLETWVPTFVRVQGDSPGVRDTYGWPSDIVPASTAGLGVITDHPRIRLQSRYDCCARAIMQPLHDRVIADGNTVIIRGQRQSDSHQGPIRHGQVYDGVQYFYPIDQWDDQDVMEYLASVAAPIPRYYTFGLKSAPDCLGCTGWLEERRGDYLARFHPEAHANYLARLNLIATETAPYIDNLMEELSHGNHDPGRADG